MKTLQEIYNDIVTAGHTNYVNGARTDKGTLHSYIPVYEELFEHLRNQPITLLEVGVMYGWSLRMWQEYFHAQSVILGNDIQDVRDYKDCTVTFGDSKSPDVVRQFQKLQFDVIIDDADHTIESQVDRFRLYFPMLKRGGIYVIEDIDGLETSRPTLLGLHPSCVIRDLRPVKGRFDDVLAMYRKP